jgi:hypothetical protein
MTRPKAVQVVTPALSYNKDGAKVCNKHGAKVCNKHGAKVCNLLEVE